MHSDSAMFYTRDFFFPLQVGLFGYICFYNVGVHGDMLNNYSNSFGSLCVKLGKIY